MDELWGESRKQGGNRKGKKDTESDSLLVSQKCISTAKVLFFLLNETSICQCRCLWHREDRRLLEMPSPLRRSHILGRERKRSKHFRKKRGMRGKAEQHQLQCGELQHVLIISVVAGWHSCGFLIIKQSFVLINVTLIKPIIHEFWINETQRTEVSQHLSCW